METADRLATSYHSSHRVAILYSTHELPHEHADVATYATAYTALRLRGLKQSPDSFSSTYDGELSLSEGQQISRLRIEKRHVIVAVVDEADRALSEQEWVGLVTLIGPQTWEEYLAPLASHNPDLISPSPDTLGESAVAGTNASRRISYWHMTALFVDHSHRRQGLAKKLCDAAFQSMKRQKPHDVSELRIIIKPENLAVVQMYEALGLTQSPLKATLAEAVVASGEAELDPDVVAADANYTRRSGIIMIKHV
jgi:ribosomal protein S18 acetylase RimI-like enzyme